MNHPLFGKDLDRFRSRKQFFSSSLALKCALRESSCRIGYEPTKNESRSLLAVDIQGHQCGGFCIVPEEAVKLLNI